MKYFFTADEHYYHNKILQYCNRPFNSIQKMNETLIDHHNYIVGKNDITVHAGDFTLIKNKEMIYKNIINRLNGEHIFLKGSHDYWIPRKDSLQIWENLIFHEGQKYYIVVCHYAMKTWARSHYNSYQLYGHSHGKLDPVGKQHDIGVDNNNFMPVSMDDIVEIMKDRPDNFNLIRKII
jgi:calcineurin-like phosphoesterase family protein